LYAYLATYANSVGNELDVSVNRMASECGVAPSTVKRSIDVLKKKGIIDRVYNGKNISLKTVLLK
jgi:DeoR/GlpR family transcriptional regulator of sugar metabolism